MRCLVEAEEASRAAARSRGETESSAEGDIVGRGRALQRSREVDNNHSRRINAGEGSSLGPAQEKQGEEDVQTERERGRESSLSLCFRVVAPSLSLVS